MRRALVVAFLGMAAACGSADELEPGAGAGGGSADAAASSASAASGGGVESCAPGQSRACWTGPESLRGVGNCHDGTQQCVQTADGEFVTSTWGPCTGEELDCGGDGSGSGDDSGGTTSGAGGGSASGAGGGGPSPSCDGICTGGQLGQSPIAEEHYESNSTITTGGGGSVHMKVVGDNNIITTDGGGSCVFDVYGSNNTISFEGGGSNVVNILDGTDNTVNFSPGGGCNSAYFEHGSLTSIIPSCGWAGDNVNGEPAEDKVYTLP